MMKSSDYITESVGLGIVSLPDICERAKKRIEEIDSQLKAADALRVERVDLKDILIELGDDSMKRKRQVPDAPPIDLDDESDESKDLRKLICKAIETGPLTNREIITKVGNYQEDAKVIRAIKYLGQAGIIRRDESPDRRIIPGPNWNERPIESGV